jgi:hypothetical protein
MFIVKPSVLLQTARALDIPLVKASGFAGYGRANSPFFVAGGREHFPFPAAQIHQTNGVVIPSRAGDCDFMTSRVFRSHPFTRLLRLCCMVIACDEELGGHP